MPSNPATQTSGNENEMWPYRVALLRQTDELCELLVKRLIRVCQSEPRGIGQEGLKSLWEEICVAIRSDHPMTERYQDHLVSRMTILIDALPMTQQFMLWVMVHDEAPDDAAFPSRNPEQWPIDTQKIARRVVASHVMDECMNYDNARIRAAEGR